MTTRLITPPAQLAVSLDDAKANLGFPAGSTDDDARVRLWLEGITAHAEHYMSRSIINQTWRVTLDRFPSAIKLSNPPIVSVSSVKYYDEDGVQQTLDPQDYKVDSVSEPGYIVPAPNTCWPATACDRVNAVEVEYVAGYGADSTATPAAIRLYILAKLVEQFDPSVRQGADTIGASYVDRLLDRHKIWGL